jgi:hypothetical protein
MIILSILLRKALYLRIEFEKIQRKIKFKIPSEKSSSYFIKVFSITDKMIRI